jgi:hypothetical protein
MRIIKITNTYNTNLNFMKKFVTVILLLTTLQTINAQEPRGYSVLVGTNIANLKTSDLKATSAGAGYFIGLGFNWGYNERFNYQLEFAATQNGINLEDSTSKKNKVDFGGIQTGFYFNYYILKPEEDKFYFGTQAGFNATFGGSQDPKGDSFNSLTIYEPSGLNGIDISNTPNFIGGVGVGLTGAYNRFRFNLRYNLGLSNILGSTSTATEPGAYSSGDTPYSAKLSSIGFTLSYRFFTKN